MRSGGVIYIELREKFNDSAANTAWVISLAVTVRMLFGKFESLLEHSTMRTLYYTCSLNVSFYIFVEDTLINTVY